MKTFRIDAENTISVFTKNGAGTTKPLDLFSSQANLADLTARWPMTRLVEVWNGIPGVTCVRKFTNRNVATKRIWKAIQGLGETSRTDRVVTKQAQAPVTPGIAAALPEPEPTPEPAPVSAAEPTPNLAPTEPPQPEQLADAGPEAPHVAPVPRAPTKKSTRVKKAPKARKSAEPKDAAAPREGSKTAQVVEMLKRPAGATLNEIMERFGWQKHTVRGFMAGAMKKAGYAVESFKPEGGERSYRIR